jgi:hypothetical protein
MALAMSKIEFTIVFDASDRNFSVLQTVSVVLDRKAG